MPHDILRQKPELPLQVRVLRRRPEALDAMDLAVQSHVFPPAHRRGGLDGEALADLVREDGLLVVVRLLVEQLPGGEAHHSRAAALAGELFGGFEGYPDLGAGGEEEDLRLAPLRIVEDITAALHPLAGLLLRLRQDRDVLARQGEGDWAVTV